jgi:hypothetical protein
VTAFVAIPAETRCWLQRPRTEDKPYTYKGAVHTKRVVVAPTNAPRSVAALAVSLPAARLVPPLYSASLVSVSLYHCIPIPSSVKSPRRCARNLRPTTKKPRTPAAARAGATVLAVAVTGYCSASGRADLAATALACEALYGLPTGIDFVWLTPLGRLGAAVTGSKLP